MTSSVIWRFTIYSEITGVGLLLAPTVTWIFAALTFIIMALRAGWDFIWCNQYGGNKRRRIVCYGRPRCAREMKCPSRFTRAQGRIKWHFRHILISTSPTHHLVPNHLSLFSCITSLGWIQYMWLIPQVWVAMIAQWRIQVLLLSTSYAKLKS